MRVRIRPVTPRQLVGVNIGCALIGLAGSLYVARQLGPRALAVIGVLASSIAVVSNFVDFRPTDLASKLFYETQDPGERAGVLQVCMLLNAIAGVIVFGVGVATAALIGRAVVDQHVPLHLVVAQAATGGLAFVSGTPNALLRLSERLTAVAAWRIVSQAVSTGSLVVAVMLVHGLGGYYLGAVLSSIVLALLSVWISARVWRHLGIILTASGGVRYGWHSYRKHVRILVGTSIFGYSKMLHRGADVLIVAAVSGDAVTGIYRFARSLTDGLYVVFDALSQVYFPRFLYLLSSETSESFRSEAKRLLLAMAAFTVMAEIAAATLLPFVSAHVLEHRYPGLTGPILLLIVPFVFVAGVHLWLWAALLGRGRISGLVAPSIVGAVVQVVATLALTKALGESAIWGAVAYVSYYFVTYPLGVVNLARHSPELVPKP